MCYPCPAWLIVSSREVTQYNDEAISRSNPALDALNMSLTLVHTPMNAGMEVYEDGLVRGPQHHGIQHCMRCCEHRLK